MQAKATRTREFLDSCSDRRSFSAALPSRLPPTVNSNPVVLFLQAPNVGALYADLVVARATHAAALAAQKVAIDPPHLDCTSRSALSPLRSLNLHTGDGFACVFLLRMPFCESVFLREYL